MNKHLLSSPVLGSIEVLLPNRVLWCLSSAPQPNGGQKKWGWGGLCVLLFLVAFCFPFFFFNVGISAASFWLSKDLLLLFFLHIRNQRIVFNFALNCFQFCVSVSWGYGHPLPFLCVCAPKCHAFFLREIGMFCPHSWSNAEWASESLLALS